MNNQYIIVDQRPTTGNPCFFNSVIGEWVDEIDDTNAFRIEQVARDIANQVSDTAVIWDLAVLHA